MRKLSDNDFCDRVASRVLVLGDFQSTRQRIRVRCKTCGNEWEPVADNLLRGRGCPNCGKGKAAATIKWSKSQDDFILKLPQSVRESVEILGWYRSVESLLAVRCKVCGKTWESKPCLLYKGYGCSICGHTKTGDKCRISDFIDRVRLFHGNQIEVLGNYTGGRQRIQTRCTECDYHWSPVARNLTCRGCPRCASPRGEKRLAKVLKELGVRFSQQVTVDGLFGVGGGNLRFDFMVEMPLGNVYIEYDGKQHFAPFSRFGGIERFNVQQEHDRRKNEFCSTHSLSLVRIDYKHYSLISAEYIRCLLNGK